MESFERYDIGIDLDPGGSFYLESLADGRSGLSLVHEDSQSQLRLVLDLGVVHCYRVANESFRLKLQEEMAAESAGIISIVRNSEFLKWFHDESMGIYSDDGLNHLMIFSADDVIDVISNKPVSARLERM